MKWIVVVGAQRPFFNCMEGLFFSWDLSVFCSYLKFSVQEEKKLFFLSSVSISTLLSHLKLNLTCVLVNHLVYKETAFAPSLQLSSISVVRALTQVCLEESVNVNWYQLLYLSSYVVDVLA